VSKAQYILYRNKNDFSILVWLIIFSKITRIYENIMWVFKLANAGTKKLPAGRIKNY